LKISRIRRASWLFIGLLSEETERVYPLTGLRAGLSTFLIPERLRVALARKLLWGVTAQSGRFLIDDELLRRDAGQKENTSGDREEIN
jgi:hypothetical protein